jgi:hypothetical protein
MNLRSSVVLVGMFLALFWVFGLMLALDRTRVDEAFVMPTLKAKSSDFEIDSVVLERKGGGENYHFTRKDDAWTLNQGKQLIKVEAFRIRDLIKEVREAKRDADVRVSNSPSSYGLEPPQAVITLAGRPRGKDDKSPAGDERQWKLFLGNESPDKKYVYAATSDRPGIVFALPRSTVSSLFFKNANDLRSKRLFDFSEPTVQQIAITSGSAELDVKKLDGGGWQFVKPNLGYADFEGPPLGKDPSPEKATEGGVKGLIAAINAVRVDADDDFVPPTPDALERNDLVTGKEALRVQVFSGDAKKPTEETLLVGRRDKDYYYARLAADEGVFKLPAKALDPLFAAVKSPEKLRNVDLAPTPIKDADAITLIHGKDEARFTSSSAEAKAWTIELNNSKPSLANPKTVESLLDTLQGRRDITRFKDVPESDASKVDADLGFATPAATAAVYLKGLGKDGKLPKDAKPLVTWAFGKVDGDSIWVKRTIGDSNRAYFTIAKSVLETLVPREGLLGYVERTLPSLPPQDIVRIEIDRGDKSVTVDKRGDRWIMKDSRGELPADEKKIGDITRTFTALQVQRWVKSLAANEDVEPFGLKSPPLTLRLTLKRDQLSAQALGSALGHLGGAMNDPALAALGTALANVELGGEKVVLKFGKEASDKADAGSFYVQHSQTDRLGLVASVFIDLLKNAEFRDRSNVLGPAYDVAATLVTTPIAAPINGLLAASPLATAQLGRLDGSAVKELRVTVRTPIEVRSFAFARKDKTWVDLSGLREFVVDADHIDAVADLATRLDMNRIVQLGGGPRADQKLTPKDAAVTIDAIMTDLRVVNVTIGANFEGLGFYTQTSAWPGAVFFLHPDRVAPLLRGAAYFAKERVAAN